MNWEAVRILSSVSAMVVADDERVWAPVVCGDPIATFPGITPDFILCLAAA
jgi:hypothetical protein